MQVRFHGAVGLGKRPHVHAGCRSIAAAFQVCTQGMLVMLVMQRHPAYLSEPRPGGGY